MQKKSHGPRAFIAGKYLVWLTLRIAILAFLFVVLESSYRSELFSFLGNIETQSIVYSVLQKILFSFIVWFFLAVSKKIIIPAVIVTISPVVGKVVRDPSSRIKTFKSTSQYLTYIIYFAVIVALILIWAYSFIGAWIAGFLGTGLIVALTFVLGLFTSSVLGNVLAYTVLNGSQEFKTGDRVQIGESYGDIVEVGIFFTRIKTIKDEVISIPNLTVMTKELKNFSALKEVLIYVSVSLGYDVDKDQAKKLLIESAEKTSGIVTASDKKPFVLLRDLGNYSITYEINAYTDRPNSLVTIKSELIDNILSEFKKSDIEILSPFHVSARQHLSSTNVNP